MADLSLPAVVDTRYLAKSAPEFEKSKLADSIALVRKDFGSIDLKTLDLGGVEPSDAKKVQEASKRVTDVVKLLQSLLAGPLKKVEDEANKALAEAKKAGKESTVRAILTALKPFRTEVNKLIDGAVEELEGLVKGVKKAPAVKDPGDKKADNKPNKEVLRFNNLAKKAVRELRAGKVKSIPFFFAAHKIKTPYKKGKDWKEKSLVHMHLRAGPSSRTMLIKAIEFSSPVCAFGEVRCEDRKKLIFDCKSPAANVKQLKDALLFQCGFAPPLKVVKGGKVEGDDAGEGEDSGEPIVDIPDDDEEGTVAVAAPPTAAKKPSTANPPARQGGDADVAADDDKAAANDEALKAQAKQRFAKRTEDIKKAITAGDRKAKEVRALTVKLGEETGKSGDGKRADELIQQLEELLDTPAEVVAAAADVIGAAAGSPELQTALRDLATLRTRAVTGVTRVADLIRRAYQGDPQAAKAIEGANKVDGAKRLLTPAVETQIAALLNVTDLARRATMASTARANVARYRESIASHELLPDVDKSEFDPNLNVIAPYLAMLQRAENLLGTIKA